MQKFLIYSAILSLLVIALLPVHHYLVEMLGKKDWLDMAFGLPIGLALALNFDIVIHKINRKK